MSKSPHHMFRLAIITMLVAGPLALALVPVYALGVLPNETDTHLVMMVYMALLVVTVGAGCVATLASCQVALHRAFSAGFKTGQGCGPADGPVAQQVERVLRLVE